MTFAMAGNTNTTAIFEAKFGWDKDEAILYNTIISSAGIIGLTIGSILGGSLLGLGRRRTIIIAQSMAVIAACISMVTHEATLSIGRLLLGIGAGIMNVAFGKMITETIPEHIVSTFAMAHNASVCIGFIAVFGLAALLPDAKDLEANKADEYWRVIWLAPGAIGLIVIMMVLLVFRYEPVAYCLMLGRDEEAQLHLKKVYKKSSLNAPESLEDLLKVHYSHLRESTTLDAASTTFGQAVCEKKYRKGTWVCFLINLFNM